MTGNGQDRLGDERVRFRRATAQEREVHERAIGRFVQLVPGPYDDCPGLPYPREPARAFFFAIVGQAEDPPEGYSEIFARLQERIGWTRSTFQQDFVDAGHVVVVKGPVFDLQEAFFSQHVAFILDDSLCCSADGRALFAFVWHGDYAFLTGEDDVIAEAASVFGSRQRLAQDFLSLFADLPEGSKLRRWYEDNIISVADRTGG